MSPRAWETPARKECHPLFQIRGVHDLPVQLGVLHLPDLGTSQALAASIIKELLYYDMTDSVDTNLVTNLARFWEKVWNEYSRTGATFQFDVGYGCQRPVASCRVPTSSFQGCKHKTLHSRPRPDLPRISWEQAAKSSSRGSRGTETVFYDVLDLCDYVPSERQRKKLEKLWRGFLKNFQWLSEKAAKKSLKLYDRTPKFHYSSHLPAQAYLFKPAKVMDFQE